LILWYILAIILTIVIIGEFYTITTGIPTITSFPSVRKKMIEIIKDELKNKEKLNIIDLGSGTGKLTIDIAKSFPKANITGIELSILPFLFSKIRCFLLRIKNIKYKRENFWSTDLSNIDAIVMYINANTRDQMSEKLKENLKPGTIIISNETELPDWTPYKTYKVGMFNVRLIIYKIL